MSDVDPLDDDFNGVVQEGAGRYQTAMRKGVRAATAVGYLKQARRRQISRWFPKALVASHSVMKSAGTPVP